MFSAKCSGGDPGVYISQNLKSVHCIVYKPCITLNKEEIDFFWPLKEQLLQTKTLAFKAIALCSDFK